MGEKAFVTNERSAERIHAFGDEIVVLASSASTGNRFCLFQQVYPTMVWSPLHRHDNEAHFVYVIDGDMEFEVSSVSFECRAGEGLYMPSGQWHRFRALTELPVRMLIFNFPGGFDNMYTEIANSPTGSEGDPQRQDILKRYGVQTKD